MSGGPLTEQVLCKARPEISEDRVDRARRGITPRPIGRPANRVRRLSGARELLSWLTEANIPWAIASICCMETAAVNLAALGVDPERTAVVSRDQVKYAKPNPDLFHAAAE